MILTPQTMVKVTLNEKGANALNEHLGELHEYQLYANPHSNIDLPGFRDHDYYEQSLERILEVFGNDLFSCIHGGIEIKEKA